jgi:hypothetical protein
MFIQRAQLSSFRTMGFGDATISNPVVTSIVSGLAASKSPTIETATLYHNYEVCGRRWPDKLQLAVPEAWRTNVIVSLLDLLNLGVISVLIPLAIITKNVLQEASNPQPSNLDYLVSQFAESLPESLLTSRYVLDRAYWVPVTD